MGEGEGGFYDVEKGWWFSPSKMLLRQTRRKQQRWWGTTLEILFLLIFKFSHVFIDSTLVKNVDDLSIYRIYGKTYILHRYLNNKCVNISEIKNIQSVFSILEYDRLITYL